jgi:dGTPase
MASSTIPIPSPPVLAPFAMTVEQSRGRRYPEESHPFRNAFQRDRDRIIHATAFRRLLNKTQVLAVQTNDHHRTRLTHTLEVAQISRTIARQLGLNEDLTEAIALSHDLGHPPFGHAGESALNACMADHGGFDHNLHALRIVEVLESPYPDFPGLNLTWEVREAMAHHSRRTDRPEVRELTGAGEPFLEARVVDAADSLAYNVHDLDDALGLNLLAADELEAVDFWRVGAGRVRARYGELDAEQFRPAVVRALIDWQVNDLLTQTREWLSREGIHTLDDVRCTPGLVGWSSELGMMKERLERFLHERVYRHPRVTHTADEGCLCLTALFGHYCRLPDDLPDHFRRRTGGAELPRVVCDYLAGMTDRFALQEFQRLCPTADRV